MNYSQAGIANAALGRIGARGEITDLYENSPNAKKVLNVWDIVFQEVLSERDWKFAKTRVDLQLSQLTPVYGYNFAWAMPADFLRFVRPRRKQDCNTFWYGWGSQTGWYYREDWPFYPFVDYRVEAMLTGLKDSQGNPAYAQFALTDYDGSYGPAKINYIRLITDYTQLLPGFVNCLTFRLSQEIAVPITEDMKKMEAMREMYRDSLNSAEAQNETMDYQKDEAGSESWLRAGRYVNSWSGRGWW